MFEEDKKHVVPKRLLYISTFEQAAGNAATKGGVEISVEGLVSLEGQQSYQLLVSDIGFDSLINK
jgi:hypothetical protein